MIILVGSDAFAYLLAVAITPPCRTVGLLAGRRLHGFTEYTKWNLGVDDEEAFPNAFRAVPLLVSAENAQIYWRAHSKAAMFVSGGNKRLQASYPPTMLLTSANPAACRRLVAMELR
jgi:hypothetical protein